MATKRSKRGSYPRGPLKLNTENCKVIEHGKVFRITIITDNVGNYLHGRNFTNVDDCFNYRQLLLCNKILDIKIKKDGTYYRITCDVKDEKNDVTESFHSRKMNLKDAQFELDNLLLNSEDD